MNEVEKIPDIRAAWNEMQVAKNLKDDFESSNGHMFEEWCFLAGLRKKPGKSSMPEDALDVAAEDFVPETAPASTDALYMLVAEQRRTNELLERLLEVNLWEVRKKPWWKFWG